MPSWVRYSVTVYVGLLLAGAFVVPEPLAAANWLRIVEPSASEPAIQLPPPFLEPVPAAHHEPMMRGPHTSTPRR